MKSISEGMYNNRVNLSPTSIIDEKKNLVGAWRAKVLTLFPEMFPGTLDFSLIGKALHEGKWALDTINIRNFTLINMEQSMIHLLEEGQAWS